MNVAGGFGADPGFLRFSWDSGCMILQIVRVQSFWAGRFVGDSA